MHDDTISWIIRSCAYTRFHDCSPRSRLPFSSFLYFVSLSRYSESISQYFPSTLFLFLLLLRFFVLLLRLLLFFFSFSVLFCFSSFLYFIRALTTLVGVFRRSKWHHTRFWRRPTTRTSFAAVRNEFCDRHVYTELKSKNITRSCRLGPDQLAIALRFLFLQKSTFAKRYKIFYIYNIYIKGLNRVKNQSDFFRPCDTL